MWEDAHSTGMLVYTVVVMNKLHVTTLIKTIFKNSSRDFSSWQLVKDSKSSSLESHVASTKALLLSRRIVASGENSDSDAELESNVGIMRIRLCFYSRPRPHTHTMPTILILTILTTPVQTRV